MKASTLALLAAGTALATPAFAAGEVQPDRDYLPADIVVSG